MMKLNKLRFLFLVFLLVFISACGETKTRETRSGRLSYVETLNYGAVGTHGSQGWAVTDRQFYVNGQRWSPKGIDVHDHIANCEASPNATVEALKCYSFAEMKETAYVLTMKGDEPVWSVASDVAYDGGDNLGQWVGDGRWLLFKDHFTNVQSLERREIRGLPDSPRKYFLAASPDLETILYREACYKREYDIKTGRPIPDEIAEQRCNTYEEHTKSGVVGLWLIDTRTGEMKMVELMGADYHWAVNTQSFLDAKWLEEFRNKLIWKKDEADHDRLIYLK